MRTSWILSALVALIAAASLFLPGTAWSQEATLASAAAAPAEKVPAMRSEATATLLSVTGTVVPSVLGIALMNSASASGEDGSPGALLLLYGMYFGPATGYWYGGVSNQAWKGVGIRLGISLATVGLTTAICSGGGCDIFGGDDGAWTAVTIVGIAALGATVYSLVHDIAGVGDDVRRRNAAIAAARHAPRLALAPTLSPAHGGSLGFVGRISL